MISDAVGVGEAGFRMKALPAATATGCIHIGTMTGKLKGQMPATTPTGWRMVWMSTPVEMSKEYSPFRATLMPQAKSRVSRPRWISPMASE